MSRFDRSNEAAIPIIDAGAGWIAVNKPAGISVHNDPQGRTDALSLIENLLYTDSEWRDRCQWTPRNGAPSPVHRLDRETSGVLLLALERSTAALLQTAFAQRETKKIYRAVLRGPLTEGSEGQWTFPLSDKAEGRRAPAGAAKDRKPCLTNYQVVRANPYISEIEVNLGTGRQHQIRRHAALAGNAIMGDDRYGDPKYNSAMARRFGFSRLMLHALSLDVAVPEGPRQFEASLPPEFGWVFET